MNNIALIFNKNNNIIFYCTSYQEADDICKKHTNNLENIFNNLKLLQLTIYD